MIVVSNTSPILNLATIKKADLLAALFTRVVIPKAVEDELISFDPDRLKFHHLRPILEVHPLSGISLAQALSSELERGEAEAIALGIEIRADLILLDESRGRAVAGRLGLHCVGILGILAEAKRRTLIPEILPILDALIGDAGFWIGHSLYRRVLEEANEH